MDHKFNIPNLNYKTIVEFNVGGKIFATLKANLVKRIKKPNATDDYYRPSLLQEMICGEREITYDKNEIIFIDRDPKYFNYILDYFRKVNEESFTFQLPKNDLDYYALLDEAEYYKVEGIKELRVSTILTQNMTEKLIFLCSLPGPTRWQLVYRGSRDGFESTNFHSKCDNIPNTLTIIKSTNSYIFGGFTSLKWDKSCEYKVDPEAYVFSLINGTTSEFKLDKTTNPHESMCSIYCNSEYGPCFGSEKNTETASGPDFYVTSNSHLNRNNYSNLVTVHSHQLVENMGYVFTKFFLAGSYNFQVEELEVFEICDRNANFSSL